MKKEILLTSKKTYAVADIKGEFYVTEAPHLDGSLHKRLSIQGFDRGTPQNLKLYAVDVSWAEKIQKQYSEAAPMNVDIFYDSVLITDQEKKNDILNRLVVVEQAVTSTTTIRSLNAVAIKKAKEETLVKKEVSSLMMQLSKHVDILPVDKCKKLQELLSGLN
jgi:hypothetical protein